MSINTIEVHIATERFRNHNEIGKIVCDVWCLTCSVPSKIEEKYFFKISTKNGNKFLVESLIFCQKIVYAEGVSPSHCAISLSHHSKPALFSGMTKWSWEKHHTQILVLFEAVESA